jgi:chloride channel 7
VGELVRSMGGLAAYSDPGIYALVGAAGVLGGVTRMTMSLAVIILELTNDIDLLLPIMLAIGVAKQVADLFNRGLYDIHIGLNKIPMLENDHGNRFDDLDLHAHSIMSKSVVSVREIVSRSRLHEVIATNFHHGFPVTSSDEPAGSPNSGRVFAGIISRQRIVELLDTTSAGSSLGKPNPDDLEAGGDQGLIDLRPHCDPSPYTVCETLPLRRVFRLFTAMGLRHLVVVDSHSHVVGMITRKDFLRRLAAEGGRPGQVSGAQRTKTPHAAVAQNVQRHDMKPIGHGDEKLNDDGPRNGRSV